MDAIQIYLTVNAISIAFSIMALQTKISFIFSGQYTDKDVQLRMAVHKVFMNVMIWLGLAHIYSAASILCCIASLSGDQIVSDGNSLILIGAQFITITAVWLFVLTYFTYLVCFSVFEKILESLKN